MIFSGERVRPTHVMPNPPVRPEFVTVHGIQVAVIPVFDLVQMKLSNNRNIDRVHIRDMDSVRLITGAMESMLPASLQERLAEIRGTE